MPDVVDANVNKYQIRFFWENVFIQAFLKVRDSIAADSRPNNVNVFIGVILFLLLFMNGG